MDYRGNLIQHGSLVVCSSEWDRSWAPTRAGVLVSVDEGPYHAIPFNFASVAIDRTFERCCQVTLSLAKGWRLMRPGEQPIATAI